MKKFGVRICLITCSLLGVVGCAATVPKVHESLGTRIIIETVPGYKLVDIAVDSVRADTVGLFCRVQTKGTTIRGHLDAVILDETGQAVLKRGVLPMYRHRKQIAMTATGFPFAFRVPADLVRNRTVRLSMHEEAGARPGFVDCPLTR